MNAFIAQAALNLGYGTTMYGFYGCIFVVTWACEFYDFCMHPDRRDEEASSQYNDSGGGRRREAHVHVLYYAHCRHLHILPRKTTSIYTAHRSCTSERH